MNLTNVFIDILRSAMTQTSCDMIEGLSTIMASLSAMI